MPQTAFLQGILRTHAATQPPATTQDTRVAPNTTLRVKMKVVRKALKTSEAKKTGRTPAAGDKQTALLQVPNDERLRRRLSDSVEFERPIARVRRRSVSFDPLTVFKTAILENDVEGAKNVLVSGKVSAKTCLDGVLPVILAAKDGCAECLELLIENGASIDVCDKRGSTPLELAVQGGHFDCAQVLIAAGANANSIRDGYFDESIVENGKHSTGRNRSRTF